MPLINQTTTTSPARVAPCDHASLPHQRNVTPSVALPGRTGAHLICYDGQLPIMSPCNTKVLCCFHVHLKMCANIYSPQGAVSSQFSCHICCWVWRHCLLIGSASCSRQGSGVVAFWSESPIWWSGVWGRPPSGRAVPLNGTLVAGSSCLCLCLWSGGGIPIWVWGNNIIHMQRSVVMMDLRIWASPTPSSKGLGSTVTLLRRGR